MSRVYLLAPLVLALAAPTYAAQTTGPEQTLTPTDERLEVLVQAAFSSDPIVESFEIVVTAVDGAVRLNGAVGSDDERSRAGSVASDVEGVTEVDNRITVERSTTTKGRSDREIRRDILDAIAESQLLRVREVSVEHGFVRISGIVPSSDERRKLTEIAFRSGATLVKNLARIDSNEERSER